MYSIQRQSLILEHLEKDGEVDVNVLAEKFSTSRETIRRDLSEMETAGLLLRTHGGAVPIGKKFSDGYEYPLLARGVQKYDEKQRICKVAAKMLEDGDTIFLDNSSTTMYLLRYVPKEIKITVVTNSIQVMLESGKLNNDNIVIISVGGIFNLKNYSLTGMLTNNFAQSFFPDKAFISCRGIDEKSGMTDASIHEIEVKRNMINQSKQFILLADYSKFGLTGAIFIGSLAEIDCVITDSKVDKQKLKMFDEYKAKIIIAE